MKVREALGWVFASEHLGTPGDGKPVPYGRLRFVIALAIIVAAISVAVAAWRAEVFGEYASHKEGLFRQALEAKRLNERLDEARSRADVRAVAGYQVNSVLARELARDASRPAGRAMSAEARREQARLLAGDDAFQERLPTLSKLARFPGEDYTNAVFSDPLLSAFDPPRLAEEVHDARSDAVRMAQLAVAFALALLLLTISEMRFKRYVAERGSHRAMTAGHWIAVLAVLIWLPVALATFLINLHDVPRLR